ncbi:LysE family translocator [Halomarina salina]|uniref:LysE family translocator n=1 Tax=Halomarina salina TaxID=1872699 RepID=A0ABD5RNY4_9EURY|nr:LysE family translocator [Halomarina salina]
MPSSTTLLAFVPAALALILAPGPDTVYVLSRGVSGGREPGLRAAAGVATGVLVHTALVVAGLAALLRAVPAAYRVVKYAGAAYLVVLGVRALAESASGGDDDDDATVAADLDAEPAGGYRRGLLVNVLNPKVALFFLAFLPQFVSGDDPVGLATLGGTYAVLTLGYLGGVALGADSLAERLAGRERTLERLSGAVLVSFGVLTVVEDAVAAVPVRR